MRDNNTLINLLIEEIKNSITINGICGEIMDLRINEEISKDEFKQLHKLLKDNKPSDSYLTEFYFHEDWRDIMWWWVFGKRKVRIDYLNKLIEICK